MKKMKEENKIQILRVRGVSILVFLVDLKVDVQGLDV